MRRKINSMGYLIKEMNRPVPFTATRPGLKWYSVCNKNQALKIFKTQNQE
jgi:hypothetical protein